MARRRKGDPEHRSLGALIQQYRASLEFNSLSESTRATYTKGFALLAHKDGYRFAVAKIERGNVMWLRDEYQAKSGMCRLAIGTLSVLMNYAIALQWRETNPCRGVKLPGKAAYRRWSPEAIQGALKSLPERYRRAIVLALYTGQREGDLIAMRWSDYDGQGIAVTQAKTGAKLWIPCHHVLRDALDAWKEDRTAVTILTDATGKPWKRSSFASTFSREISQHDALAGLVFHGLRKSAAATLAEAGCSVHEIASITGHLTLSMIQHYSKEAEQRVNARAAIAKLEDYRDGRAEK